MFTLTALVCVILCAIMAWAWEEEFDKSNAEVTAAKEEFLDLDWKDHCSFVITSRCLVPLSDVPRVIVVLYAVGSVGMVLVAHLFWWKIDSCFGEFGVTDDVASLEWYGENLKSICKFQGMCGGIVAAASWCGLIIFRCFIRSKTRGPVKTCLLELKQEEPTWKSEKRLSCQSCASGDSGMMDKAASLASATSTIAVACADKPLAGVRAEASATDIPGVPTIPTSKDASL